MYIKLTYTRPSRRGILGWLLLLLLVCTVYGGIGILEGVSIRGSGGKNGGIDRMGTRGRGRSRRGGPSPCSGQHTQSIRGTLLQSVESYLSPVTLNSSVSPPSSCPSPTSVIGGPHSPTWRNAHVMFQSVLSYGRSVACANASALVPLSVRERLLRGSGGAFSSQTAATPGVAPLMKDGVHCLTPLGRFLLHTRPTTAATSPSLTSVPSLPSVVASAVGNMIGGDGSGGDSRDVFIQRIEESLNTGLVVGGSAAEYERDTAKILSALQKSLSGGDPSSSPSSASASTAPTVPKFLVSTQKGITMNKRLQLQMLGVETRGWLRALLPERMAHVSTDVIPPTDSGNAHNNNLQHQVVLSATPGKSPIAKYVQAAMFVIKSRQTLEEEEAAKWVPTTSYISIAQHQHQLLAKLRHQWVRGGWGSKLHKLGDQPSQSGLDELETAFIDSLPSTDESDHHLTAASGGDDTNTNISKNKDGGGGQRRISAVLKVPQSLQSNGISMGDEGIYQGTPFTVLSSSFPRAFRLDDVLTPEHQSQYIKHAQERIERSKVVDGAAEAVDTVRTSFGMFVYDRSIPADKRFRTIASKLTGLPEENIEATQILRYTPGQYYKPHPDFFGRDSPILKRGGERVATMLAWLNDVPEGGETKFPNSLDPNTGKPLLVEPRAGSAILFYSMTDSGSADRGSIHEAIPPIGGDKWVAVLWIREHKFT